MESIQPIAFTLFGFGVRWYGVMIALGLLCAACIVSAREKKLGLEQDTALNLLLIVMPAAIVCARLYYVAFSWEQYRNDLLQILNIRAGGLALYGGLIGGIAAGVIYGLRKRIPVGKLCDLAAPAIAAGQAFGRWGNFFNQEAYGAPVLQTGLQFFPLSVWIQSESGWFYATFFYESCWCLLTCILLLLLERRNFFQKTGDGLFWYGLLYAAERVSVEALRTDSLYIGSVRVSQLVSALLLTGIVLMFWFRIRSVRCLPLLLPGAILCIIALTGSAVPFGVLVLLSLLQLASALWIYHSRQQCAKNAFAE